MSDYSKTDFKIVERGGGWVVVNVVKRGKVVNRVRFITTDPRTAYFHEKANEC